MLELKSVELARPDFVLSADLSFAEGKITAILGPSGGGKSTLVDIIGGFERQDRGRIVWNGQDLTGLEPAARPVATLFQSHNLFPHLSLKDNVGLGLSTRLVLTPNQTELALEALAKVGLVGLENRKPGAVSGGQQSRAALARALVQDRPILVLDEPFSALGPALKADMLDLVGTIAREKSLTVLMITHDPQDARRIADEVTVMANGEASPPVATHEIFANPPTALAHYLGT